MRRRTLLITLGGILALSITVLSLACAQPSSPVPTSAPTVPAPQSGIVKVKWFGQAAFLVTSSTGIRVITDPYTPSNSLKYGEIGESADAVTVSHNHSDHNNVAAVGGSPVVVREAAEVEGLRFRAIPSFHDDAQGKNRGNNTVFAFEVDGLKICHLGDLGQLLDDSQLAQIGKVDILLIPVGGNFTIDAKAATRVVEQLKPGAVIPMHYQTEKTTLPVAGVEEFLQGKANVTRLDASETSFQAGKLPANTQIIVLKPAR